MDGYSVETLPVQGHDAPVPNSYWSNGSDTLLITLPGLGYTNEMPIMFYLRELGIRRKWDVLQVNYDYRDVPRETSSEEWSARMHGDVRPVIDAAMAKGSYKRIVLAGKSIGTNVMTVLLRRGFDRASAYIWLTPLFVSQPVRETAMAHMPAAAVFGDADYAVQGVDLAAISQSGVRMIVMPQGDHGMMIPGAPVPQSIAALAHVMNELDAWLDQAVANTGDNE